MRWGDGRGDVGYEKKIWWIIDVNVDMGYKRWDMGDGEMRKV